MEGKTLKGTYDGADPSIVFAMLKRNSYYPIAIDALKTNIIEKIRNLAIFNKISIQMISIFCNKFSTILKAGIPVVQALYILCQQTEVKAFQRILYKIYEQIQTGKLLSETMQAYPKQFPEMLISMMEAGEASGKLQYSLACMAVHYEKEYKTQQKIQKALLYPAMVCLVAIIVVVFMLTQVIPRFTEMFSANGSQLPWITQSLISLSKNVQHYALIGLCLLIAMVIGAKFLISREPFNSHWHRLLLKLPIYGKLTKRTITLHFTRTLGILMETGVSLTKSLMITGKVVQNPLVMKGLMQVVEEVQKGQNLSNAIHRLQIFPIMVVHMIRIGEETGYLDEMLQHTADFYEDELDTTISKLTTMLEPSIIVVLGFIVGYIVLAISLPIFQISTLHS